MKSYIIVSLIKSGMHIYWKNMELRRNWRSDGQRKDPICLSTLSAKNGVQAISSELLCSIYNRSSFHSQISQL